MNLKTFQRQRNEALLSLSADKIMRIFRMDGRSIPTTEEMFWKSVHKARLLVKSFPKYAKDYSKRWLADHGEPVTEEEMLTWL